MKKTDPVRTLRGIGPKKEKCLREAGIETLGDLLTLLPIRYEDRRRPTPAREARSGEEILFVGKVLSVRLTGNPYARKAPLQVKAGDETSCMEILFFGASYLKKLFVPGQEYSFYGKVTDGSRGKQMIHPSFSQTGSPGDRRGILAVYPERAGLRSSEIGKWEQQLLPLMAEEKEWLPDMVVKENRLADPAFALQNIHFPQDRHKMLEAKFRLVFEELFTLATGLLFMREGDLLPAPRLDIRAGQDFLNRLPFSLTADQKRSWQELSRDITSGFRMNRLLQGDVGSGKTVLAEAAMVSAQAAGFQSVLMAPTELLARQHYKTFCRDLAETGYRIELLTGSLPLREKRRIKEALTQGKIDLLLATHAALQEDVHLARLGLVVTDEQHRFGVSQRKALSDKGVYSHVLVMTATPIPRTLAVVLYGDLALSQIRTMPGNRKPIHTQVYSGRLRKRAYQFLRDRVREGQQAYIVCPLVEESDKIDGLSAEEHWKAVKAFYPEFRVTLLHGAMKTEDKDRIMEAFATGKIDILVATVVIEVGIDVPNATVMIVENAERFGLAQLHQLRGRVGRGGEAAYCFLLTDKTEGPAADRVKIMEQERDGFVIAEEDLKMRGPGDVFGTRQHGLPALRFADLIRHLSILEQASQTAQKLLAEDPGLNQPANRLLRDRVIQMFGEGRISL